MYILGMKKNFLTHIPNKALIVGAVIVVAAASGGWWLTQRDNATSTEVARKAADDKSSINYNPATEEELKETEEHKQNLIDQQNQSGQPSDAKRKVTPVLVDASQYDNEIEVRAYIPSIIEDGGTCSVTITKDNLKVTKTSSGEKDATTTRCGNIVIPRSEFKEYGKWSVVISYSSSSSQGSSAARNMEVQ